MMKARVLNLRPQEHYSDFKAFFQFDHASCEVAKGDLREYHFGEAISDWKGIE